MTKAVDDHVIGVTVVLIAKSNLLDLKLMKGLGFRKEEQEHDESWNQTNPYHDGCLLLLIKRIVDQCNDKTVHAVLHEIPTGRSR